MDNIQLQVLSQSYDHHRVCSAVALAFIVNVLVRYLIQDHRAEAALATRFIRKNCTAETPCVLNLIVLCELVWVLERAYNYPRERIAKVLERIFKTVQFHIEYLSVA